MAEPVHPRMPLCVFLSLGGYSESGWRQPEADARCNSSIRSFIDLARTAERGDLDALFVADSSELWGDVGRRPTGTFEPSVLAATLLATTERIGLIITLSTTFNEPYNVARRLSSLDLASDGRIGWNIVTSASDHAARNFGFEAIPGHAERYDRASEFVEVCRALWESWGPDAVIGDKSGRWGDASQVRPIDHVGRHFRVAGPLDTPRSNQVVPLLVQAGSSDEGLRLAADHADVVFTVQSREAESQEFLRRLGHRAEAARRAQPPRVLPGIVPVIAGSAAEAADLARTLSSIVDIAGALQAFEQQLGLEKGSLDLDEPFEAAIGATEGYEGNRALHRVVANLAASGSVTVAEAVRIMNSDRGHLTVVGTADDVASRMLRWYRSGAADGFNVIPPNLPAGLEAFVDEVVPRLRSAGVRETSAEPQTLRARFGRPKW